MKWGICIKACITYEICGQVSIDLLFPLLNCDKRLRENVVNLSAGKLLQLPAYCLVKEIFLQKDSQYFHTT